MSRDCPGMSRLSRLKNAIIIVSYRNALQGEQFNARPIEGFLLRIGFVGRMSRIKNGPPLLKMDGIRPAFLQCRLQRFQPIGKGRRQRFLLLHGGIVRLHHAGTFRLVLIIVANDHRLEAESLPLAVLSLLGLRDAPETAFPVTGNLNGVSNAANNELCPRSPLEASLPPWWTSTTRPLVSRWSFLDPSTIRPMSLELFSSSPGRRH